MKQLKLIIWLAILLQQDWITPCTAVQEQQTSPKAQSSIVQLYDSNREAAPASESLLGSIYRKSRQLRCVRCYEDRYGDDRSRNYGSGGGGGRGGAGIGGRGSGYSSRTSDNWYYPYERYEDRYRADDRYRSDDRYRTEDRYRPEYDRYSSQYSAAPSDYRDRDDRLGSRTSDRYEGRGYDRYDRRGAYGQEAYGDYYRDRYYERPRGGSYDRDYYDRSSSSRYDYRNYRPWDETYRGQSGFDNSGRGYYFADEDNDRRRYPLKPDYDHRAPSTPCGIQVTDCPYAGGTGGRSGGVGDTTRVTSGPINSQHGYSNYGSGYGYGVGSSGGSGSSAGATNNNTSANNNNNTHNSKNGQGWNYADERNREASVMRVNSGNGERGRGRERERGREQQSSSYSGRAPRPLGGSYLFDRNSNTVEDDDKATDNAADKGGSGGNADGANNISSPKNAAQNGDMINGAGRGGGGANSVQTIVRDKK